MSSRPTVSLGEVCEFKYGKSLPASKRSGGAVPVYGSNGVVGGHSRSITSGPTIVVGRKGSFGEVHLSESSCWPIDTTYYIDESSTSADLKWLHYLLRTLGLKELNRAAAIPGLNREDAYRKTFPLPSVEEQRRIAAILDQADAVRAKRRQVLTHLDALPQAVFLRMFPAGRSPTVPLGDISTFYSGATPSKARAHLWTGEVPWFTPKDFKRDDLTDAIDHVSSSAITGSLRLLPPGTVAVVVRGMILAHTFPVSTLRARGTINQDVKAVLPLGVLDHTFLHMAIKSQARWALARMSASAHGTKKLDLDVLKQLPVPDAPLQTQQEYASRCAPIRSRHLLVANAARADDALFASLQARAFRGEL